jgi:hypothetical protein
MKIKTDVLNIRDAKINKFNQSSKYRRTIK